MKSRSKYSKELLEPIVARSLSIAQVLRELGLKPTGGNYRHINARIRAHELDTTHFTAARWNAGLTAETSEPLRRASEYRRRPDAEVLVENCQVVINGPKLARRLRRLGRPYQCETCGISEWRGSPLTLHLDHVNGTHNDNRLENLRFLCPNCHQQTETWGYGYKRRRLSAEGHSEVREAGLPYLVRVALM